LTNKHPSVNILTNNPSGLGKMRIASTEAKKNIGWVIREKRIQKGIGQQELCEKAEITQTFLSLLEHGKRSPSREVLRRIADVLKEDATALEKEAGGLEYDLEAQLERLVKRLVGRRNTTKMRRVIDFIETL
jgi:transcriptional regulator with XRE-family HTH domain